MAIALCEVHERLAPLKDGHTWISQRTRDRGKRVHRCRSRPRRRALPGPGTDATRPGAGSPLSSPAPALPTTSRRSATTDHQRKPLRQGGIDAGGARATGAIARCTEERPMTNHAQDQSVRHDRQHDVGADFVSLQRDATPPGAPQAVGGAFAKLRDQVRAALRWWTRPR